MVLRATHPASLSTAAPLPLPRLPWFPPHSPKPELQGNQKLPGQRHRSQERPLGRCLLKRRLPSQVPPLKARDSVCQIQTSTERQPAPEPLHLHPQKRLLHCSHMCTPCPFRVTQPATPLFHTRTWPNTHRAAGLRQVAHTLPVHTGRRALLYPLATSAAGGSVLALAQVPTSCCWPHNSVPVRDNPLECALPPISGHSDLRG